jgi:hypothetical protein
VGDHGHVRHSRALAAPVHRYRFEAEAAAPTTISRALARDEQRQCCFRAETDGVPLVPMNAPTAANPASPVRMTRGARPSIWRSALVRSRSAQPTRSQKQTDPSTTGPTRWTKNPATAGSATATPTTRKSTSRSLTTPASDARSGCASRDLTGAARYCAGDVAGERRDRAVDLRGVECR